MVIYSRRQPTNVFCSWNDRPNCTPDRYTTL